MNPYVEFEKVELKQKNEYGEEVFEIKDNYIKCKIPFDKKVLELLNNQNVGLNK